MNISCSFVTPCILYGMLFGNFYNDVKLSSWYECHYQWLSAVFSCIVIVVPATAPHYTTPLHTTPLTPTLHCNVHHVSNMNDVLCYLCNLCYECVMDTHPDPGACQLVFLFIWQYSATFKTFFQTFF